MILARAFSPRWGPPSVCACGCLSVVESEGLCSLRSLFAVQAHGSITVSHRTHLHR